MLEIAAGIRENWEESEQSKMEEEDEQWDDGGVLLV